MAKRNAKSVKPYRVFVSHATADKWIARTICEKIDAIPDSSTFRDDRDIDGGDSIPQTILKELRRCDEFLLLLTQSSLTRPWVLFEIGAACVKGVRIVPICYAVAMDQIPAMVRDSKAYELNDLERYLDELEGRVAGRLS